MTALECAETQEHAPEFALGILHGAARAELIGHLERCQACAATVADFAEIVDGLTVIAPEAEPPVGFEDHVLRAIRDQRRPARRSWRGALALGLLVLMVIAATIAGVRYLDAMTQPSDPPRAANVISGGAVVGKVAVVSGTDPWVLLAIDGLTDARYRAALVDAKGENILVGEFDVLAGQGTWMVPQVNGTTLAAELRIYDAEGNEVARARFPQA